MGNCLPERSKKLKKRSEVFRARQPFRQKSLVNIRRDEIYSGRDEWVKRHPLEKVFGRLRSGLKERVLDNEPTGGRGYFTDDTESHIYSESDDLYRDYESEIKSIPKSDESGDVWEKRQSFQKKVLGSYSAVIRETVFDKELTGEVDHYDHINESEIRSLPEKKIQRKPPTPPAKRRLPLQQEPSPPQTEQGYTESSETSELVKIFRPLIINNLLVSEVLPYLPFLENHDDLYQEVKANKPKDVAESLLVALHRSKEPGKWQKFINVLNECGYTYIVENIRGYIFANYFYQREYLKTITPKICKMINPAELIPHLVAENLISDTDKENIQQEKVNLGDIQATVLLLDRITRKNENWYTLFIKVLQEAGRDDIAANLMIPELIQSPRKKVREAHWLPTMTESSSTHSLKEIEDRSYDEAEYPLPPLPLRTRTAENSSQSSNAELPVQRNDQPKQRFNAVPQRVNCSQDQTEDNEYEMYDDTITGPIVTIVDDADNSRFQHLLNDINEHEMECKNIFLENDLLVRISTLNEKGNKGLRKQRELQNEIALKEKGKQALQSDRFYDEAEYALPPLPLRTRTAENSSQSSNAELPVQRNDQSKQRFNAVPQRVNCSQDQTDDNEYEMYDDTIVDDADTSRFQHLLNDINELEMKSKTIFLENDLLVRKLTLNEEVNKRLRKQRELQNEISLKEKEKQALQSSIINLKQNDNICTSGYDCQNDTNGPVPEDSTDAYYPTGTKVNDNREIHEPSVITRTLTNDYRPLLHSEHSRNSELPLMTPYSPPSTVQLFSPNFSMRSIISQRFELDSGIGAELLFTDSEHH